MDPSSSTSPDETTSTGSERSLKHNLIHDADVFGVSSEISGVKLPTKLDVLRYYFNLAERAGVQSKVVSYKTFNPYVTDRLIAIWSELDLEITPRKCINQKLNSLLDEYKSEEKDKTTATFKAFVQSTKELFYIGKCECDLKAGLCSCDLIPKNLKAFMFDQNNDRKLTVAEYRVEIVEQVPYSYRTIPSFSPPSSNRTYVAHTTGYDASNFAMVCDRYGVRDRVASALATALLKDIGIKNNRGDPVIMDESNVRSEKSKCRQEVLRKRYDGLSLLAFSFDGRKDDALTREKIDEKYHNKMVKEPHLVILREPNSQLIGYTKLEHDSSIHKVRKLNELFKDQAAPLDALFGICCVGEPANTDTHGGIIRLFEMQLKRPLHWFVCLLDFNELPLRHLFDTLEHSSTTATRSTTEKWSKQLETCENLPVVADFEAIALENMPPASDKIDCSTDAKFLYEMANAISNGVVPADLSHKKPGPILHSRLLTKAIRLLRLYVTTNNPSDNLKNLAIYVIKVYTPMYFNIMCYSSVVYGSALFHKFIRWTQDLEPHFRDVVNKVIKDNAYYAHSENILLAMLFDDRKEKRNIAIKKILHYRKDVEDPSKLRVYRTPIINFNCTDYTNMIDLNNDSILFEPPFTRNIPYDILEKYMKQDDQPLQDPKIPSHIQATDRHVQLLANVSKRALHESREGAVATSSESRQKLPRLASKKDAQK